MFNFARQFRALKQESAPRRAFKHALWSRLSSAYDGEYPVHDQRLHWRLALTPVAVVVLLFGMGTGTYAYASPAVGEGHPLFGMKRGLEQLGGQFQLTPEARERYQEWQTERRFDELDHRARRIPPLLRQQIVELYKEINAMDITEEEKLELFHTEIQTLIQEFIDAHPRTNQPPANSPQS